MAWSTASGTASVSTPTPEHERCLLLLPPDAPAKGRVVFGMHITSSGQVTKVNLKGPKVMIQKETGACLRRVVKSIRFRRFDGPDMVAHYPVVFD